jgi:hypothetical protein
VVAAHWDELKAVMLERSTQTNEPARCATLLPVLARLKQPIALLEVGASAGLCLFPERYSYVYGGATLSSGDADAPVFKCDANRRTPVPSRLPEVAWRAGIDLHPLSVADDDDMGWLRLLVWREQTDRLANLDRAIRIAKRHPPRIVQGDLLTGMEALASEMPRESTRVVFHSAVLAYLPKSARERFVGMVSGLDVTWISNEHPSVFPELAAKVRAGIPAGRFLLAVDGDPVGLTGPHGQSIDWI